MNPDTAVWTLLLAPFAVGALLGATAATSPVPRPPPANDGPPTNAKTNGAANWPAPAGHGSTNHPANAVRTRARSPPWMGETTVGLLLLATVLLFAVPKTRPAWWQAWWRLRTLLTLAVIIAAVVGVVCHGTGQT